MALHRVFVYGTLKKGEPNHHWLDNPTNGYQKFLGKAHTTEKYPLVIGTQYNIPFLLYSPGDGNIIQGEVYEVDDQMLAKLDELEDHPNFYVRELYNVTLNNAENNETTNIECWIYFIKKFKQELLLKPRLSSYSSSGEHNLPYCERYNECTVEELDQL